MKAGSVEHVKDAPVASSEIQGEVGCPLIHQLFVHLLTAPIPSLC